MGREGGECAGAGKERRPRHGPELAQQGGKLFLFLFFYFLSLISFLFLFFFEQNYLVDNLGVGK
jgi:hypothetical protein